MCTREELLDELLDLQHDLGKYIQMPLSFLPQDASAAQLSTAVRKALFETRSGPDSVQSARSIWSAFESRFSAQLESYETFVHLRKVVERALAWESANGELNRDEVSADLAAISPAIRNVIDEVNSER